MKFSRTPILSLTLAPPSTATSGRAGDSSRPPRAASSASTRKPATDGRKRVTPSVDACARCDTPNPSSTNTSASEASARAKPGSFFSSSGWKRRFSRSSTSPGLAAATAASTSGPTQSATHVTSAPSSSESLSPTGARRISSTTLPPGLPRCEHSTTTAPRSLRYSIVGSAPRMRESSLMRPSSNSTLKSTRTSTRLPATSMSRTVRLSKVILRWS